MLNRSLRSLLAIAAFGVVLPSGAQDASSLLPEGEGRETVASTCGTCHSLGLVLSEGRTATDWSDTIDRMRGIGAYLTDENEAVIHAYLVEHFPPEQNQNDFAAVMANVAVNGESQYARPVGPDQWPAYGGGSYNQNFSELTQVNRDNVSDLEVAWVFNSGTGDHDMGDQGIDFRFEVTPLVIGDVMYLSTPSSPAAPGVPATITALVPETGEVIWRFESPYNIHGRGIAYWPGDDETAPRIIFGTDQGYIMAVDVTTGALAPDFGLNGVIDAYVGVASEIVGESRRGDYTVPNPVTIYEDLLIAGARPGEANPPGARGDIRAFSTRDGRLEWTFHTAPQPGEPHAGLIPEPEGNYDVSGANVWSSMTLDPENGIVYAPTGDLNARTSSGAELFSSSLLALDAATGELVWYQQITHRDMWDWDSPTPVVLMDLDRDGDAVPAVLLTGKHGLVFLFDRLTGESLNGLEERATPRTNIPGVDPWPTQPFPAAPGPVALNGMTRDQIPDYVPGMQEHCEAVWDQIDPLSEGLYALPQTDRATIGGPGSTGGPNWGGGSYSPELGYYFINVQNRLRMREPTYDPGNFVTRNRVPDNAPLSAQESEDMQQQQPEQQEPLPSFSYDYEGVELSCAAGPVGALVAVDVRNLEIAWQVPLGWQENLGDAGRRIGRPNLGGNMVTASGLVFIGASNDSYFRAFDGSSGEILWEADIPAGAHSTPITYMGADGNQYVVVVAAGGTSVGRRDAPHMSDSVVAFKLP